MKIKLVLLAIVVFFASCGNEDANKNDSSDELDDVLGLISLNTKDGTLTIDKDGKSIVVEAEDGSKIEMSAEAEQTLPEDFPTDVVPIYEGGKILMSSTNTIADKKNYMVSYGSEESGEEIKAFYKKYYSKSEIKSDMSMNDIHIITAMKDGYTVSIQIAKTEDEEMPETGVSLTVIPE